MRVIAILGPPGSGKTSKLAARTTEFCAAGNVAVICSHASSCQAFRRALHLIGDSNSARAAVDTLAGHLMAWMRGRYAPAGVSPELRLGGPAACERLLGAAAKGLVDLEWAFLRTPEINLDLPFLSRPQRFLQEAAALFRQLRRECVSADEFEACCAAGRSAFYGEDGTLARIHLADPQVRARVSRRGRDAIRAGDTELALQAEAERDLVRILVRLYREYVAAGQFAGELCEEDVIAHGVEWLRADAAAARELAERFEAVVVEDADDAEPGLVPVLQTLENAGLKTLALAGWEDARIDGLRGRRSVLRAFSDRLEPDAVVLLPARHVPADRVELHRFKDEAEEINWLALAVAEVLRAGIAPHDVAILARSVDAAQLYARELSCRGLPVVGPRQVLEDPEGVADLLALAAVIDDPYDQEHLLRVLASPLLGLSDASLRTLCQSALPAEQLQLAIGTRENRRRGADGARSTALAENVLSAKMDGALPAGIRSRLEEFRERLDAWRAKADTTTPGTTVARLAGDAGFYVRWHAAPGHRRTRLRDDLARVIEAIVGLQAVEGGVRLRDLVRAAQDGLVSLRPALRSEDAVACDAIVDVKGERWRHVFVAGVAHERFPRVYLPRSMAFTRKYGLVVRENAGVGPAQTAKYAWYYAKFDAKALYIKEERRVLRYAVARADQRATVTGFGQPPAWAADHDLLAELEAAGAAT